MKMQEFCYWLQGYFEINAHYDQSLNGNQVQMIKNHLKMVFKHDIDPSYPSNQQATLNAMHSPPGPNGEVYRC